MSKVLVRKQLFDPKQTANNMAAVNDLSSGGAIEQIGLLNLLGGEKLIAPVAAEKLGYGMDSDEYKRLKTGENIGRGLAGAYGGFRTLDALASGRSPTSALGAGAGAYGSVSPIARNVGVRAAGRRMKPAAPPVAVVKPSPLEVKEHENLQDVNGMAQMVFDPKYAGPAQPARVKVAQPTVPVSDIQENMLSYGGQIKPAAGSNPATTQSQQGQPPTNQQEKMLAEPQMRTLLDRYEDPDDEEKARQQGQLQGA